MTITAVTTRHGDAPPAEEFDPQDMRNMGGLWNRMRTTSIVYIIGVAGVDGYFPAGRFLEQRRDSVCMLPSRRPS